MSKPTKTLAAVVAALFPTSEKAISEKLTQEEFDAFAGEAQEAQDRLDAQATGNAAMNADLTTANAAADLAETKLSASEAALATATTALATAQARVTELEPKAAQWDGYKASLTGTHGDDSTTGSKGGKTGGVIDASTQGRIDEMKALAARHPGMMAEFGIASQTED